MKVFLPLSLQFISTCAVIALVCCFMWVAL